MSQKASRKTITEDKDKRSTNSPVKDMKKKVAANAEKEKLAAAEKNEKAEKAPEKSGEKTTEKADKPEKHDKSTDKKSEKKDHVEKKNDKPEQQAEKSKEESSSSKEDKSGKSEKEKPETKKAEPSKQKQNGRDRVHNGVSDVTLGNGTEDVLNGTVSADSEDDDAMLVIDDHDELFPELTYDDTSDVECFEPPTPESVPSRSFTRRSQVKAARTPETPRPASDKLADAPHDEPKDSKLLKLKEDAPTSTDRKLRSSDSPKPQEAKKQDADKKQESDKKDEPGNVQDSEKKETEKEVGKDVVGDKSAEDTKKQEETVEIEIVVEVEANDGEEVQRKTDTNYSKSRVKVSPYRRSMRLADQTNTSVMANYTGNNTTMEMDITESSSILEESGLDDSSYLRGFRSIRGRSSYKSLKEMSFKHVANRSIRSNASVTSGVEQSRPTGTVVGRKRKPDEAADARAEAGAGAGAEAGAGAGAVASKRLRVLERLERLAEPLRRVAQVSLPAAHRRNAEIVGINTDLPLSAPVAAPDTFDPETLKTTLPPPQDPLAAPHTAPHTAPLTSPHAAQTQGDSKRCSIM